MRGSGAFLVGDSVPERKKNSGLDENEARGTTQEKVLNAYCQYLNLVLHGWQLLVRIISIIIILISGLYSAFHNSYSIP